MNARCKTESARALDQGLTSAPSSLQKQQQHHQQQRRRSAEGAKYQLLESGSSWSERKPPRAVLRSPRASIQSSTPRTSISVVYICARQSATASVTPEVTPTMFYACVAIVFMFFVMIACLVIAVIDLESYNFGLYLVLLCIVGTMLACALCIANPNACPNPGWYSRFCLMLQEMHPETSTPKMNGLRARLVVHMAAQSATQAPSTTGDESRVPLRHESRATVAMLAPAVHIMHQVWKGMAWVADDIEEETEEPTRSYDGGEAGPEPLSNSDNVSDVTSSATKRLSTIPENSISCGTVDEVDEVGDGGGGGGGQLPNSISMTASMSASENDVHL